MKAIIVFLLSANIALAQLELRIAGTPLNPIEPIWKLKPLPAGEPLSRGLSPWEPVRGFDPMRPHLEAWQTNMSAGYAAGGHTEAEYGEWLEILSLPLQELFPELRFFYIWWSEAAVDPGEEPRVYGRGLGLSATVICDQDGPLSTGLLNWGNYEGFGELLKTYEVRLRDEGDARKIWEAFCDLHRKGWRKQGHEKKGDLRWHLGQFSKGGYHYYYDLRLDDQQRVISGKLEADGPEGNTAQRILRFTGQKVWGSESPDGKHALFEYRFPLDGKTTARIAIAPVDRTKNLGHIDSRTRWSSGRDVSFFLKFLWNSEGTILATHDSDAGHTSLDLYRLQGEAETRRLEIPDLFAEACERLGIEKARADSSGQIPHRWIRPDLLEVKVRLRVGEQRIMKTLRISISETGEVLIAGRG